MSNKKKIVFLFSGMGSQFAEMGKVYYDNYDDFRNTMECLDNIFFTHSGFSIIEELYVMHNSKILDEDAALACVALFQVQYAMAQFLIKRDVVPDFMLGTSLGEYVAYAVSGGVNPEQVMLYLYDIVDAIQKCSEKDGMLTVLGNVEKDYLSTSTVNALGTVAAINYEGHFVVSGSNKEINELAEYYNEQMLFTYKVPSKVAFHNAEVLSKFDDLAYFYMNSVCVGNMAIPVVSCMNSQVIKEVNHSYLYDILKQPILFKSAFETINDKAEILFLDLGPMGTLENFVKKNVRNQSVITFSFNKYNRDRWGEFVDCKFEL